MARKMPVISWTVKQSPRREPKFHHTEILIGAGRFIRLSLIVKKSGCGVLRELGIGERGEGAERAGCARANFYY